MIVSRIAQKITNPTTNAADIGKLIEQDQSLTTKVLRLVNSAYYGFPKQIKSIQHAVVILGFSKVKTIIVTASVFSAFKNRKAVSLDLERFWQHSLGVAIASKAVAEQIGIAHAGEDAFIGGLLHDIGKVVLDQYQPGIYSPIVKYARDKGILLVEAEREVMGLTHAAVGEWMMEKWRLPPLLVQMVSSHHHPNRHMEHRDMLTAIHIGDILARSIGIGNGGDERMPEIDAVAASNYTVNAKFFESALTKIISEVGKAQEFFSLISTNS